MATEILMPGVGGASIAGRVQRWLCEEGQTLREGDALLVVASDTRELRVPSPVSGVVREILVDEGDTVNPGDVLALVE